LKHIKQLIEYITGMDTRIGYPNEHLAGNTPKEVKEPLYATAVGLVLNSLERVEKNKQEANERVSDRRIKARLREDEESQPDNKEPEINKIEEERQEDSPIDQPNPNPHTIETAEPESKAKKYHRTILDKWFDRFKEFLDNAE